MIRKFRLFIQGMQINQNSRIFISQSLKNMRKHNAKKMSFVKLKIGFCLKEIKQFFLIIFH